MTVTTLCCGPLDTNAYLLRDEKSGDCTLIDAPWPDPRLLEAVRQAGGALRYLLLTHGHIDHVAGLDALRTVTDAPVYLHPADSLCLRDPTASVAVKLGMTDRQPRRADHLPLAEGQALPFGEGRITVLHTPGHTPGCVCFQWGDHIFSGDTLFAGSYGCTDHWGGDDELVRASCRRLLSLPGDAAVLPGHGRATTLSRERLVNPTATPGYTR